MDVAVAGAATPAAVGARRARSAGPQRGPAPRCSRHAPIGEHPAQNACTGAEPGVRVPCCAHVENTVDPALQHGDLRQPSPPFAVPADMEQYLYELSVVNYTMWAHNAC